jgi:hypothetical protein
MLEMLGSMDGEMKRLLILTMAVLAGVGSPALSQVQSEGQIQGQIQGQIHGRWETAARLDAPRAGLGVAVIGDHIYAAGGAGLTQPRDEFESYDAEIDRWFGETPLPRGLERFGIAALNGRVYAAGGFAMGGFDPENEAVGPSAKMWSWSPEGGVWQSEVAMPEARADFSLLTLDGHLYAVGGLLNETSLFIFDPDEKAWDTIDVPDGVTRRAAASVVADNRIYIIGGITGGTTSARVDIYDPQTDHWSRGPDLPDARSGVAAAFTAGRLHIFGGRGADQRTTLTSHSTLQPGNAQWQAATDLPSPRTGAAAAVLDNGIYIIGGGSGGGFFAPFTALDSTEIFVDESS